MMQAKSSGRGGGGTSAVIIDQNPKFGWRCLSFPNATSFIACENTNHKFDLSPSKYSYKIEAFVKWVSGAGTIFKLTPKPMAQVLNFPDSRQAYYYDGHSFQVSTSALTWAQAKAVCEELGGHLATSTSAEKNAYLRSISGSGYMWLGGTDEVEEGVWKWVTGEDWEYTNWSTNQPDNANNAEHYLHLYTAEGTWNDLPGTYTCQFICEHDSMANPIPNLLPFLTLNISTSGQLILSIPRWDKGKLGRHVSTKTLTANTFQHVAVRVSDGIVRVYLDDEIVIQTAITKRVTLEPATLILGGYYGYMDEFVFSSSAGSSKTVLPVVANYQPKRPNLDESIHSFGTGEDGYFWSTTAGQVVNTYGMITSATDAKTLSVSSWSTPNITTVQYSTYGGHTFLLIPTAKTWENAEAYCEKLGGHLATSTSEEKNTFLTSILGGVSPWIGLTRVTNGVATDNWRWVTGEEYSYTHWTEGEPNNQGGNEPYGQLYSTSFWNDYTPTTTLPFLCEWDYIMDVEEHLTTTEDLTPKEGTEVMLHITRSKNGNNGNYPYAGLYAFARIAEIDGNNIVLDREITTENGCSFTLDIDIINNYYVQVITVPNFSSVMLGGTINPIAWAAESGGGIVAFRCKGDCTLIGSIITSGYGVVRCDLTPMENSRLIDRFLCAAGGGVFITCGGTLETTSSSRIGATWSGAGTCGYGGAGNSINSGYGGAGAVGSGGGGSTGTSPTAYEASSTVEDSEVAGNKASVSTGGNGGSRTGSAGGAGGAVSASHINGNNGNNGSADDERYHTAKTKASIYKILISVGGGGGGGYRGGNGGAGGQGRCKWYTGTNNANQYVYSDGGAGGIAGSCVILISNKARISPNSISTGGGTGATSSVSIKLKTTTINGSITTLHACVFGGCGGGGGTGFCYMSIGEMIDDE